jgi:hypothetical protein
VIARLFEEWNQEFFGNRSGAKQGNKAKVSGQRYRTAIERLAAEAGGDDGSQLLSSDDDEGVAAV